MIRLAIALALVQNAPNDRAREGDWFISDTTDNNTGNREVYAMNIFITRDDPNFVTVKMRCVDGKPTFLVQWDRVSFPDQTVISFGPSARGNGASADKPFVFGKARDEIVDGMAASSETTADIVATIGQSSTMTTTAHLSSGTKVVTMAVEGTQRAWARVVRHCPVQKMAVPPM